MKSFSLLLLLALCFDLVAATVDTNHSAALITSQDMTEREKSQAGLLSVLNKKSGINTDELKSKYVIDGSFQSAILRSYFENVPAEMGSDSLWYHLVVDNDKLHQIMLDQDIPVWPERRGQLFVWVVEEIQGEPLAHATNQSDAVYWLKKWFDVMGVPTQFYDPGAEDLLTFQPKDVRYLDPDLIDYILANKESSMTLLVFLQHSGTGYSYRFGLSEPDKPLLIKNLKFIDLAAGLKSLASTVQSVMAKDQRLFAAEFNENTVAITVNDLTEADHMLRLLNYLDNHALIEQYQANQFKSNQLNLMMRIKVLPDTFVKYVENEGFLQHVPLDLGQSILFNWVQ